MSPGEPDSLIFFFALAVNGALAGTIYALIALAFVLVYKASRMINFAVGEWIMFGTLLASTGSHAIGLGLGGAVVFGGDGMAWRHRHRGRQIGRSRGRGPLRRTGELVFRRSRTGIALRAIADDQ